MRRLPLVLALLGGLLAVPVHAAQPPRGDFPVVRAVLSYDGPIDPQRLRLLKQNGLQLQALQSLPVVLAVGPAELVSELAHRTRAKRVDADRTMQLLSTATNSATGASTVHAEGVTGKGVTIAVIDTGVDAHHPDLTNRVTRHIELVGPGYLGMPESGEAPIVVPFEGPLRNSDATSGHGTIVVGAAVADGTGTMSLRGTAPEASAVVYGTGEGVTNFTVLAAYDHVLSHPELGIDVVSNSWGLGLFTPYDPEHPVQVGHRTLHERGITVVQAAGNSGAGATPLTTSAYSVSPWVIGVGASTHAARRAGFSSIGLPFDNSTDAGLVDGHARYTGDRLGLYAPTVLAPGESVLMTCTASSAIWIGGPCPPDGGGLVGGTSLSAPQVAGVVALLKQVRPSLTPDEARQVLSATARPTGDSYEAAGFGLVDAEAAVALARRASFVPLLRKRLAEAQARVLADRDWSVPVSEHWSWSAPAGPDERTLPLDVPAGTHGLSVSLGYPTVGNARNANTGNYDVVVRDAAGDEVTRTVAAATFGTAVATVDLRTAQPAWGRWTLAVSGVVPATDSALQAIEGFAQDDRVVTLAASLLQRQDRVDGTSFEPTGSLPLRFVATKDQVRTGPSSPEGCEVELASTADGGLAADAGPTCATASFGYATTDAHNSHATFTSLPLGASTVVGGPLTLVAHVADAVRPAAAGAGLRGRIFYSAWLVHPDGTAGGIISFAEAVTSVVNGRNVAVVDLPVTVAPAGSRLRIGIRYTSPQSSSGRILYDGGYDSGVTFTTGYLNR